MALPTKFQNGDQYFECAANFFKAHQNLFNFPNIRVLTLNILDNINVGFSEDVFDASFNLNKVKDDCFINEFLNNCELLSGGFGEFCRVGDLADVEVPLGPKKKHEIVHMTKEIMNLCIESDCNIVVDFGSGLGYLDQLLNKICGFKVLGLECNGAHHVSATNRQNKYHENTNDSVKFEIHTIKDDSDIAIREIIHEKFENPGNICLTGLHACADLTVTAMNLFIKIPEAKAMIIIPCCYHKMEVVDKNSEQFNNFPLSDSLKSVFERYNCWEYMRTPFLRLAAQPSTVGTSLKDLVFNLLARSVIQHYADKYGFKLIRKKRKPVNTKMLAFNFNSYIQKASIHFALSCNNQYCNTSNEEDTCQCDIKFNIDEVKAMWREFCDESTFRKAAIFILLQRHLQPLFENVILYDRRAYLQERGFNCYFKKVVDDKISPRCLALVVKK